MKQITLLKSRWFLIATIILLGCVVGLPLPAHAQICPATAIAGNNTVYETCTGTTTKVGSYAYVDVAAFDPTVADDICTKIFNTLSAASTVAGSVLDARGVLPGSGTSQTCGINPFNGITKTSIVLLPAGTIVLSAAWGIPGTTQVIGEGPGVTTLQANATSFTDAYVFSASGGNSNPAMIHMGTPNTTSTFVRNLAFGIKVLHLSLDGQGQKVGTTFIDGIDNTNAEEQSYVEDVTINNILGNGLYLGIDPGGSGDGAADHSGPYNEIVFQEPVSTPLSTTVCVNVVAGVQARALRGITCAANTTPAAAILLDGSNVSVENVRIDGFQDGILIGDHPAATGHGPAEAILLSNIVGTNVVGNTNNLIHIANSTAPTPVNVAVHGATSAVNNTLKDDLTSTTLTFTSDPFVGFYAVGYPIGSTGYTRFSSSPRSPAWLVGSTSGAISGSCADGALFSSTTGTGGTLWTCVASSWVKIQ
jgi:hypothetical protein